MKRSFWGVLGMAGASAMLVLSLRNALAEGPGVRFRDMVYKTFEGEEVEGQGGGQLAGQLGLPGKPVEFTALEYKVLLLDEGSEQGKYVDPKQYRFKVGDRIKIVVRPLTKSYIYIYHVGASGRGVYLVPREDEQPKLVEPKKEITLPEEGFLQFVEPPGNEVLYVVAAAKPVRDRELLARVITSKDPQQDTPEMRQQRKQLNAVVQSVVKSEAERRLERDDGTIKYRGLFGPDDRKQFVTDLKSRGVTWGSVELPPDNPKDGTVALGFRSADTPPLVGTTLVVTIPLRSTGREGSR